MIYVCDAIMGSGKSSAVFNYINEHPEKKYIYIAPLRDEDKRIAKACKELRFAVPKPKDETKSIGVVKQTELFLKDDRNIATTHQALKGYTPEMLQMIKDKHYVLIMDESLDTLQNEKVSEQKVQRLLQDGYIELDEEGRYHRTVKASPESDDEDLLELLEKDLVMGATNKDEKDGWCTAYWAVDQQLITSFEDVLILTYMFESQDMYRFLKMHNMDYRTIGVGRTEDGRYQFIDGTSWLPEWMVDLADKIHIDESERRMNLEEKHGSQKDKDMNALSDKWLSTHKKDREQLRKNIYSYFRNDQGEHPATVRMWTTYGVYKDGLTSNGYSSKKNFLAFNTKATNDYSDRKVLVYAVNLYFHPFAVQYYAKQGIEIDKAAQEAYALSTMVQWIWRSAIRNGEDIWIYIPSMRMKALLKKWISDVTNKAREQYGLADKVDEIAKIE